MPQLSNSYTLFSFAEQEEFRRRAIVKAEFALSTGKTLDECRVEFMRDFADWAHQGHFRKFDPTKPYATHPHEIADKFKEPELKQLAEGHDIKEDTNITRDFLDSLIIRHNSQLMPLITEDVRYDFDFIAKRKGERYFDYNTRMSERSRCAMVKQIDCAHNKSQPLPAPLTDKQLQRARCRDVNEFYYDYVFQQNAGKESLDCPRISFSQFLQDEKYGYLESLPASGRMLLVDLVILETSETHEPGLTEWLLKTINEMNHQPVTFLAEVNVNHLPIP